MFLCDHIERYEKAIREHWDALGERKRAWTELHNVKVKADYMINNEEEWDSTYFKLLQKYSEDYNIKIPKAK